jgi:hypothetical protein
MAYLGPAPANSIIATSDIEDGAVTSAKLGGNIVTPGTLDVNGQELILDANANTSITADTDDTIDIKVAGADDFQITANTMSVLSGSTLNIDSGATIANSGTATGFGGDLSFGGDTFGANKVIGSNDTYSLSLETDGNTALTIDTTGAITKPLQPSFLVNGTAATNATGDGTLATIAFSGSEVYDQNSDYDGTNTFTAPVTGKYLFTYDVYYSGILAGHTYGQMRVVSSNKTMYRYFRPQYLFDSSTQHTMSGAVVLDMDASDTCYLAIKISGSTLVIDLGSSSLFAGCLLH